MPNEDSRPEGFYGWLHDEYSMSPADFDAISDEKQLQLLRAFAVFSKGWQKPLENEPPDGFFAWLYQKDGLTREDFADLPEETQHEILLDYSDYLEELEEEAPLPDDDFENDEPDDDY